MKLFLIDQSGHIGSRSTVHSAGAADLTDEHSPEYRMNAATNTAINTATNTTTVSTTTTTEDRPASPQEDQVVSTR